MDVPAFIELEQGFELCLVFGPLLKKALVLRKIRRVAQLDHGRAPVDGASLGAIDAGYGAQISGDIQRFVYIQGAAAQQIAFFAFHRDLFPDGVSPVHDGHGGDAFLQEGYLPGQLDAADILNQFLSIDEADQLTNTVFMGMGEPLDNYDAVSRALEVLTAPWGFAWSPKRITVSTIGVLPALKKYLDGQRCHLAVSLHNPFPEERLQMMPAQKAWDIREILDLIRQYDFSGQRRVSFEYTMFKGFNDDKRHADALIRLLRGLECRVNLIRFHKIPDFPYDCATDAAMEAFRDRLNNHQVLCTIRSSRGEDILAACGMLAGQHTSSD